MEGINVTSNDIKIAMGEEIGTQEFNLVSSNINSVEEDDGGCRMDIVLQRKSDNLFFMAEVTQWDLDDSSETHNFTQVFEKTRTETYYE